MLLSGSDFGLLLVNVDTSAPSCWLLSCGQFEFFDRIKSISLAENWLGQAKRCALTFGEAYSDKKKQR
jgi:hypothetical protein